MADLTLTDFLLARIAEDEDAIRRNWNGRTGMTDERWWGTPFQPSRALAECEAKRRIVAEHPIASDSYHRKHGYCELCQTWDGSASRTDVDAPCPTLAALATVYADHPDYREEWRP